MPFYPLSIPAGCYRNGTEYQSAGRWYDMAGIRFVDATIRPVGGWLKAFDTPVDGPGRGMLGWRLNSGNIYCAIGTPNKLWVFNNDILTDITPDFFASGVVDTVAGIGFGSGRFGSGPFGSSSAGGSRTSATEWSLAAWGDHLLAMATHDNGLYEWAGVLATKAALVANSPTGTSFFVTQEQIAVVVGAGDNQRRIQWCDVQNNTVWTPAPNNLAGDHLLVTDGVGVVGLPVRAGNLILTTVDAHFMDYVGPEQVYRFTRIDTGCGVVGVRAATNYQNGNAAWMGARQFFMFDGVSVQTIPCEVSDYVFGDINLSQLAKVSVGSNQKFGEITWFYPSAGSMFNDRSVTWNFLEKTWAINGQPPRGSWVDAGAFDFPLAVDESGYIYNQEDGWTADGTTRAGSVFARTGPIEIGVGDQVVYATKVIPDEVTPGAFAIRFATRFAPEATVWDFGPYTLTPFTDIRLAGRQVSVRIETVTDADSRIGRFRIEGKAGGGR